MLTQKLLTLCACLPGLCAVAQPVLQNNVFPDQGDQITTVFADTAGVAPGAAGANQVWDFSNLQMQAPIAPLSVLNAAGTPYAVDFPFANLCGFLAGDPNYYFYYRKETSQLSNIGSAATYGLILLFNDPETLLKVPLNFGGSFTDDFSRFNTFPDNQLQGSAHKTATYDAYGTLKTPLGTFQNAMRLSSVTAFRDTTWLFAGYSINEHTDVTFEWYVPNRPMPQVSIAYSTGTSTYVIPGQPPMPIANEPSKIVQFVNGLSTDASGPSDGLPGISDLSVAPNPASDQLTLRFSASAGGPTLLLGISDATGRTLLSRKMTLSEGPNAASIPVSDLPPGAYFLRLSVGGTSQTLNWQKF